MREEHLQFLVCPTCRRELEFAGTDGERGRVLAGSLRCTLCSKTYPIRDGIPRFVPENNYSRGFGFQWNRHDRTQDDSFSGASISEDRFFAETRWPRDLKGQLVLEAGCGAGRFTAHASATGATVISFDYTARWTRTTAATANWISS